MIGLDRTSLNKPLAGKVFGVTQKAIKLRRSAKWRCNRLQITLITSLLTVIGFSSAIGQTNVPSSQYNPYGFDAVHTIAEMEHPHTDLVMVASHRGLHALVNGEYYGVPENSLEAIGLAAQKGLEQIELDIKLTSDGVPIMSHDQSLGRETNAGGDGNYFNPFGYPPGSSQAYINSIGRPGVPDSQLSHNPVIANLNLASAQQLLLRTTVPPAVPKTGAETVSTLQQVLNYLTANKIQMVLALDLRDPATAHAAYGILANTNDSLGRPYTMDALFKVPAVSFLNTDPRLDPHSINGPLIETTFGYPSSKLANVQPVFNTGDAGLNGFNQTGDAYSNAFGSEAKMEAAFNAFLYEADNKFINFSAVEIQYKQDGGNITDFVAFAKQRKTLTIFSPYTDHEPTPQVPGQFYTTFGYCCVELSTFFSPGDTADNRPNIDFLTEAAHPFEAITRDDPEDFRILLAQRGLRNLSYLTNDGKTVTPPPPGQPTKGAPQTCKALGYPDCDSNDQTTYTLCASDGGTCTFTGDRNVAYGGIGSDGITHFAYKTIVNSTTCSASVFGNINPGAVNSCYISSPISGFYASNAPAPIYCADEGERCDFIGDGIASMTANHTFSSFQSTTHNGYQCDVSYFYADPAPGFRKACFNTIRPGYVFPLPTPAGYRFCSGEDGAEGGCHFKGLGRVLYGVYDSSGQGHFFQGVFNGGAACSNSVFGDPYPSQTKNCFYQYTSSADGTIDQASGGDNSAPPGSDPLPPPTVGETSVRRPDPSAISVNGTFYSVESNEDTGAANAVIYLRAASSLAGLGSAPAVPIFADSQGLGELWAPEIMHINNTFYVYFTMGRGSAHRMYVISSPTPDSGYGVAQKLMLPDDKWAIDGTTFVFNGQRWFAWSGWPGDTNGEQDIYIAKMSDPITSTGSRYQISQPHEYWEQASGNTILINEGVEAIKDPNGQLHIVYSANGSWTDQYCLGDLRLKASGDPSNVWDWHKSNGCEFGSHGNTMEPNGWFPTLYANGPGHHTFVLPDGDINQSPNAAYPNTAQFMYHAVPKGVNYSWANRVRYVGAYTWYNNINYNRCCVPGDNTETGYSLMFFEDPGFTPHPPPSGPPPGSPNPPSGPIPGATGITNADPSVMRIGNMYISAESDGISIYVRQATSPGGLSGWPRTKIWTDTAGRGEVWAPEIQNINGLIYIYFSMGKGPAHRMYAIRSASILAGYLPLVPDPMGLPDGQWAVDGNAFMFNGQRYFVWSGWPDSSGAEQDLYIAKMTDPITTPGPRYAISQPREPWETVTGRINEAPAALIDPDGRFHIFYSANGSWTDQYCIADLRLVAGGDPTNVWDWHKSNGCQFGSNRANMAPGYDPTLYVNGPGSHSFVLLFGDTSTSPTPPATEPLMYHAVPKGTPYSWVNRMWFNGAFQWYHGPDYTRCCVPGSTDDPGWSVKFYEDPNYGK